MNFWKNPWANLGFTAHDPVVTQPGGGGRQKVVTAGFEFTANGWRDRIILSGDLDAALYQDAKDVRRRAARAVVPSATEFARQIASGAAAPEIERARNNPDYWQVAYIGTSATGGFERRAKVTLDFKFLGEDVDAEIAAFHAKRAAAFLKAAAQRLHAVLADPLYEPIFGAG